jgi:hypothetical protein
MTARHDDPISEAQRIVATTRNHNPDPVAYARDVAPLLASLGAIADRARAAGAAREDDVAGLHDVAAKILAVKQTPAGERARRLAPLRVRPVEEAA